MLNANSRIWEKQRDSRGSEFNYPLCQNNQICKVTQKRQLETFITVRLNLITTSKRQNKSTKFPNQVFQLHNRKRRFQNHQWNCPEASKPAELSSDNSVSSDSESDSDECDSSDTNRIIVTGMIPLENRVLNST